MWEEIRVKETIKLPTSKSSFDVEHMGIKNSENGFTLIGQGMRRDFEQEFLCKSGLGEFKFLATRWNSSENSPSDRYIVYTKLVDHSWHIDEHQNEKLIYSEARNIESALLSYPSARVFDFKKAKEVWFAINEPTEKLKLVHAEDM